MITRSSIFRQRIRGVVFPFLLLLSCCATQAEDLQVSAAVSLKQSLEALTPVFQAAHPGARISLNFGASGSLARQIEAGAPVDVFLSASSAVMDRLDAHQLVVSNSRKALLGNQIVLVINPALALSIKDFSELAQAGRVGLGDPSFVPVGQYGRQTLEALNLWQPLQGKLVYGADAHQVLTYALRHEVDAALVFATDTRGVAPNLLKVVAVAPSESHQPIHYEVARIAASTHGTLAMDYLRFLESGRAGLEFTRNGFTVLNPNTKP